MSEKKKNRKKKLINLAKECGSTITFREYIMNYLYDVETPEAARFIDLKRENEELHRGLESVKFEKMKHSDFEAWVEEQQKRTLETINYETDYPFLTALKKLVENYSVLFAGKETHPASLMVLEDIKRKIAFLEHPINLATVYANMKVFPDYLASEELIYSGSIVLIKDAEGFFRYYQNPALSDLKKKCFMNAENENLFDSVIEFDEMDNTSEIMEKIKRMEN